MSNVIDDKVKKLNEYNLHADNKECKYTHFRLSAWVITNNKQDLLKEIFIYGNQTMGKKSKNDEIANMCNIGELSTQKIWT